jgi:hypothetical protein
MILPTIKILLHDTYHCGQPKKSNNLITEFWWEVVSLEDIKNDLPSHGIQGLADV